MKYEDFMELLKYRRSIRKFKPDPIPDEYITKILDAARYAMSGANSQPWQFIVIRDSEVREKMYNAFLECYDYVYHLEQQRIQEYRLPALDVTPEEKKNPLVVLEGTGKAPPNVTPAAGGLRQIRAVVTVEGIDRSAERVTLKGPQGKVITVQVLDPSRLDMVSLGSTVSVTYTEALAISLEKVK